MRFGRPWVALGFVAGIVLQSFASGEPVGWRTRGVMNAPLPDLTNAPALPAFAQQGVFTNAQSGTSATRRFVRSSSAPGLPATLPASDDARIRELARGLDHDWQKCYSFVRDHIAYAPYFGILRGPERTLLDREGNDADQALLLLALLRASGHDATVAYEPLAVSGGLITSGFYMPLWDVGGQYAYNAASWLDVPATGGVDSVLAKVCATLSRAGRPVTYATVGSVPCVVTDHFWVVLAIDNLTYYLDPSFKPTVRTAGRDAAADMGYSRAALVVSAGGAVDGNSVKNVSVSGLAARLDACSAALRAAWTNANAAVSQFVGVASVAPQRDDYFFHGNLVANACSDLLRQDDAVMNGFRASATLSLGTLTRQFFLDELGARHLWISFDAANSAYPKAVLKLDDAVLASESAGSSAAAATMALNIAYAPASMSADYSLKRNLSHVYVLPVGFGGDARGGMRTWATDELAKLRASGVASGDVRLVGRALQVAGQQWLAQTALAMKFRNRVSGGDRRLFYDVGVAGQAEAPYVDIKNSYGYSTADPAAFDGGMLFSSALEHAVLDQLNGTNAPSVSTVKVLELANASGLPVYFANTSNYASVANALVGYTAAQKAAFQSAVSAGRTLLLPKCASVSLNSWTGYGYVEHGPSSGGSVTTGMIISGGMNGGYGTVDNVVDTVSYTVGTQPTTTYANGGVPESTQADPVAMPSGAFLDSRTDLAVAGGTPLAWTRHYDSRGRHDDGDLGRGWSHGYEASVVECADPDAVFGRSSVEAAIPTVVAVAVVDDLLADETGLSAGERARRLMLAALTVQWWTRHLVGATVSVTLGARSLAFQRKTDGSFAPYPGVTAALTHAGGVYTLAERLGNAYRFNAAGRLAAVADRSGNVTTLTYDSAGKPTRVANDFNAYFTVSWNGGRISRVTDSAGRSVAYAYNSDGCLVTVTDARSKAWTATYDSATCALLTEKNPENQVTIRNAYNGFGQVTNQVAANGQPWTFGYAAGVGAWDADPLGHRLVQSYTDEGRVRSRTDRDGATASYVHDGHGHVVAKTDAAGRTDFAFYDDRDNLIRTDEGEDGLCRLTDFAYDERNRLVATTNALGEVTAFAYDSHDRLLNTTFPDGTVVTNVWNSKGLLTNEKTRAADGETLRENVFTYATCGLPQTKTVKGSGLPAAGVKVATYTYSPAGLPLTVADANTHKTTFTYDAAGNLLTSKAPDNGTTTRAYSNAGRLLTVRDALNRVTTTSWTPSGKLARTRHPDGTSSTNVYDAVDDLASVTDARGATTAFARDAAGRVVARTTASGTDRTVYNILGLPIATTNAAGVATGMAYDWLYRPVVTEDALGNAWRTGYDLLDRVTSTVDPRQKARSTAYDGRGRRVSSVRPTGAAERFAHDGLGNLVAMTNAEGHVYRMSYDALGRRLSSTDATGRLVETNVYDGVGNLLSRTDGNGTTVSCAYDACDRLTRRTAPGVVEDFAYDAVGNLVTSSNGVARENFAYDAMNRLVAATTRVAGVSFPLRWRYDAGGLVTNVVYAPGKTLTKKYDTDGRLASVSDWLGHVWTFAHDGAGKPTGGTSPDGTAHGFAYDAAGRLAGWNVGALMGRTIQRDAAGRRVRDTVTAGPMPRSSVDRRAVNTFDAADRLVSASVTYAVTNAPVVETYLYDGNGALTNFVSDGETRLALAYDAQGRIASPAFAYDALGNRIRAGGHIFIPDHADPLKRPLLECAADGTVLRHYLWGNGRLLGSIDATNALTVAHSDGQGSVIALTTPDGTLLHMANYGPHGEDWGSVGTNATPFAWLGGYGVQRLAAAFAGTTDDSSVDCCLGPLYLTCHRLYSATLHRFLSADPLGPAGGYNLYAYANGNPLAYIDPLGLCAGSGESGFFDYLGDSAEQVLLGNYTEKVTALGTAGQIAVGLAGVDLPADVRDITYDLTNWEWSWSHAGQTALDAVALVPVVGAIKYGDEVGTLIKSGTKLTKGVDQSIEGGSSLARSSGPIIRTSTEAREIAKANGWAEVKGVKTSNREAVYTDGRRYYSRDNTSHKGGLWKEVDSHGNRLFTLDGELRRIGK